MNRSVEHDDIFSDWIQDGPTVAPDRVLDSVARALPETSQRSSPLRSFRRPAMQTTLRGRTSSFAAPPAVAAVLLVLVVGGSILVLGGRSHIFGGPDGTPTPVPSPTSSATATANPTAASPGPIQTSRPVDSIAPSSGVFSVGGNGLAFEYRIPDGVQLTQAVREGVVGFGDGLPGLSYGLETGVPGRGVVVAEVTGATFHATNAGQAGRVTDAESFLHAADRVGYGVGEISSTEFAGLPALAADQSTGAWATTETPSSHVLVLGHGVHSRLIVADVGSVVVLVQIWASDRDALAEWLPTAQAFVDSMRVVQGPSLDAHRPCSLLAGSEVSAIFGTEVGGTREYDAPLRFTACEYIGAGLTLRIMVATASLEEMVAPDREGGATIVQLPTSFPAYLVTRDGGRASGMAVVNGVFVVADLPVSAHPARHAERVLERVARGWVSQ
jgi:hypothetical protein